MAGCADGRGAHYVDFFASTRGTRVMQSGLLFDTEDAIPTPSRRSILSAKRWELVRLSPHTVTDGTSR
jgi:hypothetical protein